MARTLIGVRCTINGREATLMASPLEALHSESRGDMADFMELSTLLARAQKCSEVDWVDMAPELLG